MKLFARLKFAAVASTLGCALTACSVVPGGGQVSVDSGSSGAARTIDNGPAADYPVTVGDPFVIDGVTYTPIDTLNYDEVGYAAMGDPGEPGVTGALKTLPYPSYVEVTALDSGRTALIRIERRGPMDNGRLISLSPMAAAQLGVGEGAPVRVRRVNPPEDHRAELRSGREAPLRMETPQGLLDVLRRKLPVASPATRTQPPAAVTTEKPAPTTIAAIDPSVNELPVQQRGEEVSPPPSPTAPSESAQPTSDVVKEAPAATAKAPTAGFVVQIGAFSMRANADRLAKRVNGHVAERGQLALVRVGPFESRGQAEQALAKLRSEGYRDARIESVR